MLLVVIYIISIDFYEILYIFSLLGGNGPPLGRGQK